MVTPTGSSDGDEPIEWRSVSTPAADDGNATTAMPDVPSLSRQRTANYHPSYHIASESPKTRSVSDEAATATKTSTAATHSCNKLRFAIGASTHPGGNTAKPNQDDYFIWKCSNRPGTLALCVLDGHGRELGDLASRSAKSSFLKYLEKDGVVDAIERDPESAFRSMFGTVHEDVMSAFEAHYTAAGKECVKHGGYLLKRSDRTDSWGCVHGGTTVSIVVVVDGHRAYVANVGDSSVVIGGALVASRRATHFLASAASQEEASRKRKVDVDLPPASSASTSSPVAAVVREITADHSPENVDEYRRMRKFRPHPTDASKPELRFVYDSLSWSKASCNDIFRHLDVRADKIAVTNRGEYYKNVRQEWATLVCTPPGSRFQDALAFTRSIGDFHLQSYGVSHEPEVCCLDLRDIRYDDDTGDDSVFTILVASDGVWDNWLLRDSITEVLSMRRDHAKRSATGGAVVDDTICAKIATAFMEKNLTIALRNFGKQADNMTAIVCFVEKPLNGE